MALVGFRTGTLGLEVCMDTEIVGYVETCVETDQGGVTFTLSSFKHSRHVAVSKPAPSHIYKTVIFHVQVNLSSQWVEK